MSSKKILMPRIGVNDDEITLDQWLVKAGSKVKKGQAIAIIETAKKTDELKTEEDGYINFTAEPGEDIRVGDVVAEVFNEPIPGIIVQENSQEHDTRTYTKKARAILDAHPEIDISKLPETGIIKESDVARFISAPYHIEKTMSNHMLIYGRGGLCKNAIEIINQTRAFCLDGIVDFYYPQDKELYGIPVVGGPMDLERLYQEGCHKIISAVAFWGETYSKHYRKNPYPRLKRAGFELVNLIDRTASIASTVKMGEGNLICANVYAGADAVIGSDVILNVGCVINHDCIVSDHCHIATGALLAGEVVVGENTLIGQGTVIYAGVKIGKNVTINNGCKIFKNVPDGAIVEK